jgi:RHS repeat-associated protein
MRFSYLDSPRTAGPASDQTHIRGKALVMKIIWITQVLCLALHAGTGKIAAAEPRPKPNRTLPVFQAPSTTPRFSAAPKPWEFRLSQILPEPLVPIGGKPSAAENKRLSQALMRFHGKTKVDDFTALEDFLQSHPRSAWNPGIRLNLGMLYFKAGLISRSIATLEQAWEAAKSAEASEERRVSDRIFSEYVKMLGRMGRVESLETLLKSVEGRPFQGAAMEGVRSAREGLDMMKNRPLEAFRCGPIALVTLMEHTRTGSGYDQKIQDSRSTPKGMSMQKVVELTRSVGMKYRLAKRRPGAAVILPALMHWKERHYSAVLQKEGGVYHIVDPTFREDLWMTDAALDAEASGYFLVPEGPLPEGWTAVSDEEAATVWGAAGFANNDAAGTSSSDPKVGGAAGSSGKGGGGTPSANDEGGGGGDGPGGPDDPDCGGVSGMPVYSFHAMVASLNIEDIPVGHTPPRGPSVNFRVTYNQREAGQPSTFNYSNLGPKWTFGWLGYLVDSPISTTSQLPVIYPPGGGSETHINYDAGTGYYKLHYVSRTKLKRVSWPVPIYERNFADGSKEVYSLSNGATAYPRKVFLSKIIDAKGDTLNFSYDAKYRLRAVTDALGQVSTLSYELGTDSLKITKVTDPFGRFATFEYDAAGRLTRITDVIGLQSTFAYDGTWSDFIRAMTTPYGTTRFSFSDFGDRGRSLEATDPMGRTERLEYRHDAPGIGPETLVPTGLVTNNTVGVINKRNTFYWDKKAMLANPGDYTKARIYHWMHTGDINGTGRLYASIKPPLESRIWFNYPGQGSAEYMTNNVVGHPSIIGRVLDDSTTQLLKFEYNAAGNVTKAIDPLNRESRYAYASNLLDLVSVRQKNGSGSDLLDTLTYNSQHLPLTATDASGQTASYAYNPKGQLLSVTNPRGEIDSFFYDSQGYLTRTAGPQAGDTAAFTYDGFGRLRTVTDRDGYTSRTEYDALDRPTKVAFPDSTYKQFLYDKLDLSKSRDRRGRWSHYFYNAVREMTAVRDALGRTTSMEWCGCGNLESMVDPEGRTTRWTRDIQGRLTEKEYADGRKILYAYQNSTSLLRALTDAKAQVKNFQYFKDGGLKAVSYTNAQISTPTVGYAYDSVYARVLSMTDGVGLTQYAYAPITVPPSLGAGRLAGLDGPFSNDSVTFAYDSLGRVRATRIQGILDSVVYDSLGRVTTAVNALGAFSYKYQGVTGRLDSTLFPNGQKTAYSYFNVMGDLRLQEIRNLNPALALLSRFAYTYDTEGQIKTWTQQADSAASQVHHLAYDPVDQLLGDVVKNATTGAVLKQYAYAYDKSGNRLSAQEDSTLHSYTYNTVNQALSRQGGGRMYFRGRLNEPGTLTLNGVATSQYADSSFDAQVTVNPGVDTVTVVARDYANNATTNRYEVSSSGSNASFTYDLNGNMTGDGARTFEWDAEDRLVAVSQGLLRSEFTYDGQDRRVRIVELDSGSVTSQKNFLWMGNTIAEERDASGGTVAKRFFGQGVQVGAARFYYTWDHLGSIREMTDSLGVVVARYGYDPYGVRTKISGSGDADFGFTGHYLHGPSGLYLTKYRAYEPGLGRWISRDPIEEDGGINLYGYLVNDPVNLVDPLGLRPCPRPPGRGPGGRGRGRGNGPGSEPPVFGKPNTDDWGNPRPDPRPPSGKTPADVVREVQNSGSNGGARPPNMSPPGSRRPGAYNEAKRSDGIPTSQQPNSVNSPGVDNRGNPVPGTRDYNFTRPDGTRVVIRDHRTGHKYSDDPSQNRGPHFNNSKGDHYDY